MKPLTFMFTVLLLFTATLVAQDEPLATKRVHHVTLPLRVSNTVGGTYVDSYVVQVKKVRNFMFTSKTKPSIPNSLSIPFWPEQKKGLDAIYLKIAGVAWHPGPVITKFGS